MPRRLTLAAAALAALFPAGYAAAQEPSTSPAPSPLTLNIEKDARQSRVGLDYAVRWDFSDLASFRPSLGTLYSGIKAVTSWDITENTRLDYYGFRTNPWRLIITKEKKEAPEPAPEGSGGGLVTRRPPEYRRRVRLSVSPLVDDLKRNFDANLSEFLLRSSLKGASPEWERMGAANRKYLVRDVLALPVWQAPVPGVGEAREGLEYLGR